MVEEEETVVRTLAGEEISRVVSRFFSCSHSCGFTSYDYRPESFEVAVENGRVRFVGLFWRRELGINPKEKFLPAGKKFVSEITGQPLSISSLLTV